MDKETRKKAAIRHSRRLLAGIFAVFAEDKSGFYIKFIVVK